MRPLYVFAAQIGAKIPFSVETVVKKDDRFFLLNAELIRVMRKNFCYAGTYLGKAKGTKFYPSFDLLAVLAREKSNKVVVDRQTAWLFICGRDIFRKGILSFQGSSSKGTHTLILNEYAECLGFGKIVHSLGDWETNQVAVVNISDIGDFLRRE